MSGERDVARGMEKRTVGNKAILRHDASIKVRSLHALRVSVASMHSRSHAQAMILQSCAPGHEMLACGKSSSRGCGVLITYKKGGVEQRDPIPWNILISV